MNKKTIILFLFIFCLLSTIAMSVWGKVPDPTSINVTGIAFTDVTRAANNFECELNDDDEKIIYLARGTTTYQLTWKILPEDASDKSVSFQSSNTDVATVNETGLVTIYQEYTFEITIYSNLKDAKSDNVNIDFTGQIITE